MIGHNSIEGKKLSTFVERVEALENEKLAAAEEVKAELAAAKAAGFDPATIRAVVKLRRETAEQREKRIAKEETLDLYKSALSMLD